MVKHLYLILITTFIFGFVTGAIVFLQNNTGKEGGGAIPTDTRGFEILAYMYGACEQSGCDSYRITADGTYTYIVRKNQYEKRYEGSLNKNDLDSLRTQLAETSFANVEKSAFGGTCPATRGDIAYRYDITYKGTHYTFDSCKENLSASIFSTSKKYFEVFNATHAIE